IYLRLLPGEKTLEKAARVTRADVIVGDRVLVVGAVAGADSSPARQLIVMGRGAGAGNRERDPEEWRRRGIVGRVTAVNTEAREITLLPRSRGGDADPVAVVVTDRTRILRYAPDSARVSDARPASFADLRVGDQLRALGDASADGARFVPEEIIAGSFARFGGTVAEVNAARGEVTINDDRTGQRVAVAVGRRSTLKRVSPELAETLGQRRERRRGGEREGVNRNAEESAARPRPEGQGGRNLQQVFESLPAITLADLKKGDAILVTASTTSGDTSRVTAVTLMTGDAALVKRLRRLQGRLDGDSRDVSPGLPGDVMGGGTGGSNSNSNRDEP
ncbi:MAG: hypothetical protein ACRD68_10775, partial [Pyrinomonadaceae bacterium]